MMNQQQQQQHENIRDQLTSNGSSNNNNGHNNNNNNTNIYDMFDAIDLNDRPTAITTNNHPNKGSLSTAVHTTATTSTSLFCITDD